MANMNTGSGRPQMERGVAMRAAQGQIDRLRQDAARYRKAMTQLRPNSEGWTRWNDCATRCDETADVMTALLVQVTR